MRSEPELAPRATLGRWAGRGEALSTFWLRVARPSLGWAGPQLSSPGVLSGVSGDPGLGLEAQEPLCSAGGVPSSSPHATSAGWVTASVV